MIFLHIDQHIKLSHCNKIYVIYKVIRKKTHEKGGHVYLV